MDTMTPEQIVAAMQRVLPAGNDGITQAEISDQMGWSRAKTMRGVQRLVDAGAMKCTGRARRMRVDGIVGHKPVYAFVNPPKKKSK